MLCLDQDILDIFIISIFFLKYFSYIITFYLIFVIFVLKWSYYVFYFTFLVCYGATNILNV